MKKFLCLLLICTFSFLVFIHQVAATEPRLQNPGTHTPIELAKLPGVSGFGQDAVGGMGGKIMAVTNLNESGPGSLREAIEAEGPRIIIFEVAGVIDLNRNSIRVTNPFVTIAGHSAPPPGITLIQGGLFISTHEVIVQHIRVRPGEAGHAKKSGWEPDAISTTGGAWNVIIDHCTAAWAPDENLSASGPRFNGRNLEEWRRNTSHKVTLSNNLIAHGLSHSTHEKGEHSKGSLIHDNTTEILIYGNFYAHNVDRHPLAKGGSQTVLVNNYIYNPGRHVVRYALNPGEWEGHEWVRGKMSVKGNYIEYGPSTEPSVQIGWFRGPLDLFWHDNLVISPATPPEFYGNPTLLQEPPLWPEGLAVLPAEQVKERALRQAGAFFWARDEIDARVIEDAINGTGKIIDSEEEVGGYPVVAPVRMPFWIDQNQNHLPDWWEEEQGLDLNNPENAMLDSNGNDFTNLEDYLNDLEAVIRTHRMIQN